MLCRNESNDQTKYHYILFQLKSIRIVSAPLINHTPMATHEQ